MQRDFLGSHRLSRDQLREVAFRTVGLEVDAHAIFGRMRFGDDSALRIHNANGGVAWQPRQLKRDAIEWIVFGRVRTAQADWDGDAQGLPPNGSKLLRI